MQYFSTLLAAAPLLLAVISNAAPAELALRQISTAPVDTSELYIGACLAVGYCYFETNKGGCYTHGCNNITLLGAICSCSVDVQAAIDVQTAKGQKAWPLKCPY